MPYYCTVPRCTSMAGKAKNVSFHQFPRDEELAKLWNRILKRGKPYTKYSKVCSLHFKPEDYTITSVGKNRGQWRTLRKDAIPSQNLPSDTPAPYHRTRNTGSWVPGNVPHSMGLDPQIQQQMAQAIYMQTMIAMQAGATDALATFCNGVPTPEDLTPHTSTDETTNDSRNDDTEPRTSYKCTECSKCFKDPDVFKLHQRIHSRTEKENYNSNESKQETLKSNPILANLLKNQGNMNLDVSTSILSIENQIMTALAANMESYIRNLILTNNVKEADSCNRVVDSCKQENDSCNQKNDQRNQENDSCNQDSSDYDSRDIESESNLVIDESAQ
ncbi:uncharacterized protein LOC135085781 [Ostrinia nubilalis]|uniref:uncharacterized protein LOC135085781 n=1 Tax=Ostrinia nubilalis TaxID=29057 RepID=UPI003082625E